MWKVSESGCKCGHLGSFSHFCKGHSLSSIFLNGGEWVVELAMGEHNWVQEEWFFHIACMALWGFAFSAPLGIPLSSTIILSLWGQPLYGLWTTGL